MTTLRLRHVFAAALAVCLLALGATDAHATHFRYGTIRWEVIPTVPPNPANVTIRVTHESAWRLNYENWPSPPTVGVPLVVPPNPTGQLFVQSTAGGGVNLVRNLVLIPSFINTMENWFVGSRQEDFTFAKSGLPVRIFLQGTARLSAIQDNNNDITYRVESIMTATPNAASPAASILPIITLGHPSPAATFFIPAADVEGDAMTWSISPQSRSLLTKTAPDGENNTPPPTLTINSLTGEVTWNTAEEAQPPLGGSHFYSVQFMVTDSKGGETPVDALLRLIRTVPNPPLAHINDSPDQYLVSVRPNNQVTFTVKGIDNDLDARVSLTSGNVPLGATMVPSLPTAGTSPQSSVFTWTPTLADAGNNTTIQFAVTDEFGNQDTNSAVITVLENFLPTVTCPAETIVEATGPGGVENVPLDADVFDQDPQDLTVRWFVDGTLFKTETVPAGPEPGPTQAQVHFTHSYAFVPPEHAIRVEVNDGQAPTQSCLSKVTVVDTRPPVLNLPPDVIVEATGPNGAIATYVVTATDPDGVDPNPVVSCSPLSGSMFPLGTTPVECTAEDASGNESDPGTFLVIVRDTTPPDLTVPADITLEATEPGGAIATFVVTATDDPPVDPNPVVTCTASSGSLFALGTTPVVCTARDASNNVSPPKSFNVIVQDTTPPVVTVPNTVAEATSPAGAAVTINATAVDIVDGNVTPIVCTPASGSTFQLGTTPVTCTATDNAGNTGTGSGQVTVQDTRPPVITNNPGNLVREATGPAGAVVTWPPLVATDIVDPSVPVICAPASGTTFAITPPAPVVTVTCTATDDSGNMATATFTVRVEDTRPPVISGYGNITATGAGGAVVTWPPPTAVDIVDGVRPVTCLPVSGSFFPLGATIVTCTSSDTRTNTATITFTVTVLPGDTKPPKVCLKLNPGTLWPPNHKMRTIQVILKVTDNEDPTPTCTITNVTSSEPVTGTRYGNTTPDWVFSGLNLQLRAERYSKHGRTYTVTVVCRDDAGNATTTKGTVRVPHDQGHGLLDGDQQTNNPNQSGQCCTRPRPDNDEDDDDDDHHFWTNDPDKAGFGHDNPCPKPPDMDDDDDDHGDDDDDDDHHLSIKTDPTGTN